MFHEIAKLFLKELDPEKDPMELIDVKESGGVPAGFLDPWGNPWRYRSGSRDNMNPTFDLWSPGPDGVDGTSDDIRNW